MSNATEIEERVNAGFAELSATLRAGLVDAPDKSARLNAEALEREQARVRAEYLHLGIEPPSPLALSITARRDMALRDETNQPAQAAE